MSTTQTKLITLALVGACSFGAWKLGGWMLADEAQGTRYVVNHLWIDHVPQDDRDMVAHMVVLDHPQGQFGVMGRSSQWRHLIDVFKWRLDGDKLGLYFPQERARGQLRVETWRCEGEAPAPFELCMKLTANNGRSVTLYSRDDWELDPKDAADSLEDIADEQPELGAVLAEIGEGQVDQLEALELDEAERWPLTDLGLL